MYGLTGIAGASTLLLRSFYPLWATLVIFRSPFIAILTIVISSAAALLPGLGTAPLWDDDEPKNAACTMTMLDSGDWIVPTYNGTLRVEKPPLVNWIQIAGVSLFGRNEFGVRIGSTFLTVGTCILTWWTGRLLAGPLVGLLSGLVMSTCIWTGVGGRAATPDASLVFCTTLAATIYAHAIQRGALSMITKWHAIGIGLACGLAVLAKGPVGIVLPVLAFFFTSLALRQNSDSIDWRSWLFTTANSLRLLTIFSFAAIVALPWYLMVGLRTNGQWITDFLFIHNAGRFASPMEGHSGSILYYPMILAIGMFPWSIILLAIPTHALFLYRTKRLTSWHFRAVAFAGCWVLVWVGAFSLAGTKLPGYIWPAYPAISIATALYLSDWISGHTGWEKLVFRNMASDKAASAVMQIGWFSLAVVGGGFICGLPMISHQFAPGNEWLGLLGFLPIMTAIACFILHSCGKRGLAVSTLICSSVLFLALLGGVAAVRLAHHQGAANLLADLSPEQRTGVWASIKTPRPSLVFYTGGPVKKLSNIDAGIQHLRDTSFARLVVRSEDLPAILPLLPPGFEILNEKPRSFDSGLAVIAKTHTETPRSLAQNFLPH